MQNYSDRLKWHTEITIAIYINRLRLRQSIEAHVHMHVHVENIAFLSVVTCVSYSLPSISINIKSHASHGNWHGGPS